MSEIEREFANRMKKDRLEAGNWLACFEHCISALRLCSSY